MATVVHSYPDDMARTRPNTLLTREEARAQLIARGISVQDFAKKHGLSPAAVYKALYGLGKGRRGESHRASIALGIKAGEVAHRS